MRGSRVGSVGFRGGELFLVEVAVEAAVGEELAVRGGFDLAAGEGRDSVGVDHHQIYRFFGSGCCQSAHNVINSEYEYEVL
jgi:hypothetical protein